MSKTTSTIANWLEEVGSKPNITGAMIIDKTNGLCLGVTGKAKESEAAILKYRFEAERKGSDSLLLESKGSSIWMFDEPRSLVALYTDSSSEAESEHEHGHESEHESVTGP